MKNYLFTIGISQYPNWGDLNNASNDAKKLSQLLLEKYQFESDYYQELLDEEATIESIMYHLDNYLLNLTSKDNMVIVFCGHGYYDQDLDEGYWVPHEGRKTNRVSMIPISTIEKFLGAINSHHTLVIADSCFSGSLFRGTTESKNKNSLDKLFKIPSRWALTSGRLESVSDGPKGKSSPFMSSIISNLEGDRESYLSITDLSQKVLNEVGSTKEQTPRGEPLNLLGHKGGQFVFYPRGVEIDIDQKKELVKQDIPDQLIILFKEYNSSLADIKQFASEQQYNEAADTRDIKDGILNQLLEEINKSLEEFKFENSDNINKLIDIRPIDELRIKHKEIKNKKNELIRSQKFEAAAQARDEERKLIEDNQEQIQTVINEFKNKCAELIDENIYILYSFINQFIGELPFLHYHKHKDIIQNYLHQKFIFEIMKKVDNLDEIDLRLKTSVLNMNLLKALKEIN